jgi:hypothetical protein
VYDDVLRTYAAAQDFHQYRGRMRVHARAFTDVYERLQFVRDTEANEAPLGRSRILVLTEDFCIDSVLGLPLIARLAEASPDAELRVASHDAHYRLADKFPARGGISRLPTAIVFNYAGDIMGYWSERSKRDHQWMAAFVAQDPIPEIVLEDGRPVAPLADWMERRLKAQLPYLLSTSWRCARDELAALANP